MTKLQKLLFILHGYYLATTGKKLINEQPRAWPFGPVFPDVHKYVDYTMVYDLNAPMFAAIHSDMALREAIDKIIDTYARYSARQLSRWSHMRGSPWERTTQQPGFKWSLPIDDIYIKEYFLNRKVI